jgi:hypothetical protein
MATTLITLSAAQEGKLRHLNVELNADDVNTALTNAGTRAGALAKLPTGDGEFVYVNPAHVVMARETSDVGPMAAVFG